MLKSVFGKWKNFEENYQEKSKKSKMLFPVKYAKQFYFGIIS